MMRHGIGFLATLGLGLVVITGCGGSGATQGAPAATTASGTTASAGATAAASSAASVASQPASGGGTASGVCALVTTDELAGIFGVPVTAAVIAGPPDTCDIQADGAPLAAMVLTPSASSFVFDAYASDPQAVSVPGIGDKAAYSPTQQLLVILKGAALVSIAVLDEARTPEQRLDLMKKMGVIAAGRM